MSCILFEKYSRSCCNAVSPTTEQYHGNCEKSKRFRGQDYVQFLHQQISAWLVAHHVSAAVDSNVVSSVQVTSAVCDAALRAALGNRGYRVSERGLFLEATKDGKKFEYILRILPVSRFIADWDSVQEITASVSFAGVKKLLEEFGTTFLDFMDIGASDFVKEDSTEAEDTRAFEKKISYCVAFGICAGSYRRIETVLADLRSFLCPRDQIGIL